MDFFVRKRTAVEEMEAQEHNDFYPPRFEVFLVSSPKDPTLSGAKIRFKGADCGLQYDIHLDLPDQDTGPSASPLGIIKIQLSFIKSTFIVMDISYNCVCVLFRY